ncbi:aldehyde dehydrogenase family protein [Rhodococcoides fascians]|uniref:aldehyde dehydrogenase family protein n=1 Tax=Rhodococcoides fascians TaxID=1828 RepID=UPI0035303B9E
MIRGIDAGAVFVNRMSASYPQLPFGGTEDSGLGKELSMEGIRQFVCLESVWRSAQTFRPVHAIPSLGNRGPVRHRVTRRSCLPPQAMKHVKPPGVGRARRGQLE